MNEEEEERRWRDEELTVLDLARNSVGGSLGVALGSEKDKKEGKPDFQCSQSVKRRTN